ncbi:2,4-dienoyl-CoA reductase [Vibrio xiamenensis]|uniref:2,4-dienoyl-CoA reductase n=1 Tax=Vibrio xiamenensis TaxID=861298 RepID=A0A1G8DQS6_9VIBR|nr:NADH:flavin oxidoreductase [Vibrio xiamenensis]SDH60023.1 2,4-dienoyl-CoA reductase [Vibrio xiamenensis]
MSKLSTDVLFRPFQLKSLTLKNRIVMAPMTRTFATDGIPGQNVADYYRRRAEGDVGLILSEGTVVDRPAAANHPSIPHFYGDKALSGWQNVINSVHQAGGAMGPQLWHVGATQYPNLDWKPEGGEESPSGLNAANNPLGHAMSEEDIADTIAAFAKSAAAAKQLGFDTFEIHGAHGYLIDQFFWPETNQRKDAYNGLSIKQRSRFAAEVIAAMRAAVGEDFPIILRVSQWKQQDYQAKLANTPDEMSDWLLPLVEAGVDILHCSQRRFWEPEFADIDGEQGLNFAGWAKKLTGAATISVGSVGLNRDFLSLFTSGEGADNSNNFANLIQRMENEEFDLIAVGRALISDPNWATKVKQQRIDELTQFEVSALGSLV